MTFSLHYEWKDRFCIVSKHIWKFQLVCWFEMNFPSKIANAFARLNQISEGCEKIVLAFELFEVI